MPQASDKFALLQYKGILEFYFETGMEQMGCIFHDDRGNHDGPKWDNPSETMTYRSLSWALWFSKKCMYKARIFDPKTGDLVYEGPLTHDKKKIKKAKYRYSFLPKELDKRTWLKYCEKEYRAEIYTNDLTHALKEEYKVQFEPGTAILDTLTGTQSFVLNYTLDEAKKEVAGYWINEKTNNGWRSPSEIRVLTFAEWTKLQENQLPKGES